MRQLLARLNPFVRAPFSSIENVEVDFLEDHQHPGLMRVEISISAVVGPARLKDIVSELAYGPRLPFEKVLGWVLPYVNRLETCNRVVEKANKVLARNRK